MSNRLSGKNALVTGAAQGIGRAVAEMFLSEGAHVVATDINESALNAFTETVAQDGLANNFNVSVLDVTDHAAIERTAAQFGSINVLVNCSGVVKNGTILDCSESDWSASIAVNTTAMFHTISAFLPGMLAQGTGSIINIASIVSSLRGAPNRFAYGASKGAVLGITKSVAIDFIEQGIRCNAICPGTIDSPSLQQRLRDTGDYNSARENFINRQPMKRLGKVEEVAALATMLASDEALFMTGEALLIDGGWGL